MSKDPAVLFYTSDFLASTFHLSDEQVGKFIRLLCMQHQRGRLSEDDLPSGDNTASLQIRSLFKKDENGYFNERMEEEIIKRKKYTESRRDNWAKRTQKADQRNEPNITEGEENEQMSPKRDFDCSLFEELWEHYPKKIGKTYAKKCFLRLKPTKELTTVMIKALEEQKKWDMWIKDGGQYIPNPSTWLNQKRWLDVQPIKEEKRMGMYI